MEGPGARELLLGLAGSTMAELSYNTICIFYNLTKLVTNMVYESECSTLFVIFKCCDMLFADHLLLVP